MNQNLEDEINETRLKESKYIHATAIGFFLAMTFSVYTLPQCGLALSRIPQHSQNNC